MVCTGAGSAQPRDAEASCRQTGHVWSKVDAGWPACLACGVRGDDYILGLRADEALMEADHE